MRNDMAKVLNERPRYLPWTHGKKARCEQLHERCGGPPGREPIAAQHAYPIRERAHRDMLVGPIRRFLATHAKRGSVWADVYSELCSGRSRSSKPTQDLIEMALLYVAQNVCLVDGQPQPAEHERMFYRQVAWVHPETGVLMPMAQAPRDRYKPAPRYKQVPHSPAKYRRMITGYNPSRGWEPIIKSIQVAFEHRYVEVGGRWLLVQFRALPDKAELVRDAILGELELTGWRNSSYLAEHHWGRGVYAFSARGLGSREEKVIAELTNAPALRRAERRTCVRP